MSTWFNVIADIQAIRNSLLVLFGSLERVMIRYDDI